MIKRLFDPLFTSYCLVWLLVHGLRKSGLIIPLINDHLTDLLAVPAIAHLTITIMRLFIVKDLHYRYPFSYVMIIVLYLSFVFEYLMPEYSPVYTGDAGDVAAYCCGAIFYYFVHGKMNTGKRGKKQIVIDPADAPLH